MSYATERTEEVDEGSATAEDQDAAPPPRAEDETPESEVSEPDVTEPASLEPLAPPPMPEPATAEPEERSEDSSGLEQTVGTDTTESEGRSEAESDSPVAAEATEATEAVEPAEPAAAAEPAEPRTVGRAIADALAAAGTRFVFTVPGESFLGLLDGFADAGVRVVATRHEGAAAFMASAASQLSGRPQVVLATRAVGASNAAIGIHAARADSAPLVALFGQVRRDHRGREAFQEVDLAESIGSLALWAAEARDESDALRQVGEGLRRQSRGRPGPIVLSLPEDVIAGFAPGSEPQTGASAAGGPAADRTEVRQILKWLAAASRPVILAGGGVLRARSSKRLMLLSETLQVPVIASWRRPDVVPNDHPNYLGTTGYWAASTVRKRLEDADVVLVLGCRLNEVATFGYSVPGPGTRWAHVDVEPRTGSGSLPAPDLSVVADAARFLDACWSDLRGAALDAETRSQREASIAVDRAAYLAASQVDEAPSTGEGVHPGRAIGTLQRLLPAETLLTTDAGNFGGWLVRGFRFMRPGTFAGTTSGAMGFGLPAAIAGSLLRPDRPSVALCGDGGFAMSMAELETAVRERVRVIAIVFDNGEYGTIRMHQDHDGHQPVATTLGPIDFAAVARAAGALGFTATDDDAFEAALEEALASRQPSVIHLKVDRRWVSVDEQAPAAARPPETV
ncbi:MAG: acetolactate synthase large subunit [Chloroflexota bacterium]|nr:acetolactate synthase large subunit [Chloroflexota bacterium]